jgi:hypothetical protein
LQDHAECADHDAEDPLEIPQRGYLLDSGTHYILW